MSVLVVDVGNTNIKLGVFTDNKLDKVLVMSTHNYKIPKHLFKCVITKIYIGSVVPSINQKLSNDLLELTNVKPHIFKVSDFQKEFDLARFNKTELGTDILSLSLYIKHNFTKGAGICFGTASYAVAVDGCKLHGAIIAPAIITGIEKLKTTTSMIKRTSIEAQPSFKFGTNTVEALMSGATHMTNGFLDHVINYCRKQYNINKFIITGGKTRELKLIKKFSGTKVVDNAVLLGYWYLI